MPLVTDTEARDTILHEIAHAKAGIGQHHNLNWKIAAMSVGARPEPCSRASFDAKQVGYKYIAPCNCGPTIHGTSRRPTRRKQCRKCRMSLSYVQQY
jgi:predicted SprT family Zn-dependent metalloprotease